MKDILIRTFKTFIAAALSCLLSVLAVGINFQDNAAVSSLIISVLSAGITAVMNGGIHVVQSGNANDGDEEDKAA